MTPASRPHQPRDRRQRGFTIFEVGVASIIMVMAITTSITTMQRGFQSMDSARCLTIAGQIMQSELEKTRLKDWTTVSAYPTTETALTLDPQFTSNQLIANRSFQLFRSISNEATNMLRITYRVQWRTLDGRTLSRTYMTIYARNGLYDFFFNTYTGT